MPFRPLSVALALTAALVLAGCANTVRGVGQDVKQTGQAIKDVVN